MRNVFLVLLCLLLAGCASFSIVKLGNGKVYAPSNPAGVRILTQEPSLPYVVIGEVRAQGETISVRENMEQRLKEKAAAIGADAIILKTTVEVRGIVKSGKAVEQNQGYGIDFNKMFTKKMVGKVIKYK